MVQRSSGGEGVKAKGSQFAAAPGGPVYHGSGHGFKAGDTIDPTPDSTHMGPRQPASERGGSAAFGVTNTSTAGYFGVSGAIHPREGQGRLFASVYEVEPKSEFEHHPSVQNQYTKEQQYNKPDKGDPVPELPNVNAMPIDRKGFTVKRHAAFAFPDQEYARKGIVVENLQETP